VRSRPDEVDVFFFQIYLMLQTELRPWGQLSLLTEMSTKNLFKKLVGKGRPGCSVHTIAAIC
jgi:hypothetical protein